MMLECQFPKTKKWLANEFENAGGMAMLLV